MKCLIIRENILGFLTRENIWESKECEWTGNEKGSVGRKKARVGYKFKAVRLNFFASGNSIWFPS